MTEEEPETPTARRQRAHDELDRYLDELLAGEEEALASNGSDEARYLYTLGLLFARNLVRREVRDLVAPKALGDSPVELRKALLEIIDLLRHVWPAVLRGSGRDPFFAENIWPSDIMIALEKLDVGETMPIFKPSKGLGKHEWTERRFRFLAVLWAIYLQRVEGNGFELANNLVAHAFDPAVAKVTPDAVKVFDERAKKLVTRIGGLPQGPLPRWRRHIEAVAAGGTSDEAIPRKLAEKGIAAAMWAAGAKDDRPAWIFGNLTFGIFKGGKESLVEAGKHYQEFTALRANDPDASRKRAQRANKPKRT